MKHKGCIYNKDTTAKVKVVYGSLDDSDEVNIGIAKTLSCELDANPSKLNVGKTSRLTAIRTGGTAEGSISYQFDCGDGNGPGDIQDTNIYTCKYNHAGTKVAKVKMIQGDVPAFSKADILVVNCISSFDYFCEDMPSCDGSCGKDVEGKCYRKDSCSGSITRVSNAKCSGVTPPFCKKTCESCGSSNWIETQIYR